MTTSLSRPLKPEVVGQVMSARGVLRSRTEIRPGGTLSQRRAVFSGNPCRGWPMSGHAHEASTAVVRVGTISRIDKHTQ